MLSYLGIARPAPNTDIRNQPGSWEVRVSPPASLTPQAGSGPPPSLTCIVVKHRGHVLLWEGVVGVAHQQAGFPHGPVPHHHAFQHLLLLAAPAAAAAVTLLAVHSRGSRCCA